MRVLQVTTTSRRCGKVDRHGRRACCRASSVKSTVTRRHERSTATRNVLARPHTAAVEHVCAQAAQDPASSAHAAPWGASACTCRALMRVHGAPRSAHPLGSAPLAALCVPQALQASREMLCRGTWCGKCWPGRADPFITGCQWPSGSYSTCIPPRPRCTDRPPFASQAWSHGPWGAHQAGAPSVPGPAGGLHGVLVLRLQRLGDQAPHVQGYRVQDVLLPPPLHGCALRACPDHTGTPGCRMRGRRRAASRARGSCRWPALQGPVLGFLRSPGKQVVQHLRRRRAPPCKRRLRSLREPLALSYCVRADTLRVARRAGSALVQQVPRNAAGRGPPARAGAPQCSAVCCRSGARNLLARRWSTRPRHALAPSLARRPRLWRRACKRALVGRARSDRRGRAGRARLMGHARGTATMRCAHRRC